MPMFDFLTDVQYIALGRVVVNAAELESLLATILTNLLELEKQARALIPVMMARKIELLEKLHPVDDEVGKKDLKDLKDLTRVLRDLNDKRNTVVHGIWYPAYKDKMPRKKLLEMLVGSIPAEDVIAQNRDKVFPVVELENLSNELAIAYSNVRGFVKRHWLASFEQNDGQP